MSDGAEGKSEEPTTVEASVNGTREGSTPESSTEEVTKATTPPPPAAPVLSKPKYRHDWYQTESDVCINILIKKVKKENLVVDFQEKSVSVLDCISKRRDGNLVLFLQVMVRIEVSEGDVYNLSLNLAHRVNVEKCFKKVYGSKVNEINL